MGPIGRRTESPSHSTSQEWSALAAIMFLFVALFLLSSPVPANARQVLIRVGENYMRPNDVHVFAGDTVSLLNESSVLTHVSFGENCEYDTAKNAEYGEGLWPVPLLSGEIKSFTILSETHGTVLHIFSDTRCKSAVASITVYEKAKTFEKYIPAGVTVRSSKIASGGTLELGSLAIDGTLKLDSDFTINVTGTGLPSDMLEAFYLGPDASIECNLSAPQREGVGGAGGYNLTMNLTGAATIAGTINLSGMNGSGGTTGASAVTECQTTRYPNTHCTGSCVYYDDDECKTGCDVCDSGWLVPDGCDAQCGCCVDVAFQNGGSGSAGGNGGKGGDGGHLVLVHNGGLYGLPTVIANGGAGGAGGTGGGGTEGCDGAVCGAVNDWATAGSGGAPGLPGRGGKGGIVEITTSGSIEDDYFPERSLYVFVDGGAGGAGGVAGLTPQWSETPGPGNSVGGIGGAGGTIKVNAGCTVLQARVTATGGAGGAAMDEQEGSTLAASQGGNGGSGGEIVVQSGSFDRYYWPTVVGGAGGKGGDCGSTMYGGATGSVGGRGGNGGKGGTCSISAASILIADTDVKTEGGTGGEGGACGTNPGQAGSDGAAGTYNPQINTSENGRVAISAGGTAAPGELIEYTVLAGAYGTGLDTATVTAEIPAFTTYVSASGKHTRSGNTVTWDVGSLSPCQGKTLSMLLRVDPNCPTGTVLSALATLTSSAGTVESDPVSTTVSEDDDGWIDVESLLGSGKNQALTSEPVNPATGNFVFQRDLFHFPGKGLPVRFVATYNAQDTDTSGPLGAGWTHTFNVSLSLDSDSVATVKWGDGHKEYFQRGEGVYVPVRCTTTVVMSDLSSGGYQAKLQNGTRYVFNISGVLQSIADLNGNTIALHYDDAVYPDRLTSVVDTAGRTIRFTYTDGFITQITAPLTRVRFGYSAAGDLSRITDGRGNARTFRYDTRHRMVRLGVKGSGEDAEQTLITNAYDAKNRILRQTNGLGEATTYAYATTTSGGTTTITPPDGNAVVHTFDKNYNLTALTDGEGYQATFQYNVLGNCVGATDKLGASMAKTFDTSGNPIQLTNRLGETVRVEYDANNRPTTIQDPVGNVVAAAYDEKGNQTSITDQLNRTARTAYNAAGLPTALTNTNGLKVRMGYNGFGLPVKVTDALGYETAFEYDAAGRPTLIGAEGKTLNIGIAYDANGNPVTVTDPMGSVSQLAYDRQDNLVSRTYVPLSATTTYEYDLLNRLTAAVDPEGGRTVYSYDSAGNMTSIADPDGITTTFDYDRGNRLVAVHYANGTAVTYGYDANGNRTSATDQDGRVTAFAYDAEGRPVETTDASGFKTSTTYDTLGRVTARADEMGRVTAYEYDVAGRLTRRTLPNKGALRYIYDGSGNLIKLYDEMNRFRSFAYDKAEHLVQETFPGGDTVQYAYDVYGRLVQRTDGTGAETAYAYDLNSRITEVTLPGGSTVAYTYDAAGRLLSAGGASGTAYRTFDKMGRVLTVKDEKGSVLRYAYTPAGRTSSVTYPGSKLVTYGYDTAGRLSTVQDWAGNVTTYHYDDQSRVIRIDLPNGTYTTRTYNAVGHLTKLQHRNSSGNVIASYVLTYDRTGEITGAERTEPGISTLAVSTAAFQYSAADQPQTGTFSGTEVQYTFDENGNLTAKTKGSAVSYYGYDPLNRLVSVYDETGATLYTYDEFGNRSGKTVNGVETRSLSVGDAPYYEYPASGTGTTRYLIYGGALLYSIDGNGEMAVYHTDERGSVVAVTNAAQQVVRTVFYDPYGRIVASGGTFDDGRTYLGQSGVRRDENGLYYMKARYYDPSMMRFLTRDPLGVVSGANPYLYAADNPIGRVDPSGLDSDPLGQENVLPSTETAGPSLPGWVAPGDVGISFVGLTFDPASAKIVQSALKEYDLIKTTKVGTVYVIPKALNTGGVVVTPLSKFAPLGKRVLGATGKVFTALDVGVNTYNAGNADYTYYKNHKNGNFLKDLWNQDPDALSAFHESTMAVNSYVGAKFPAAAPYCATFTFADYAMDEYGVKVVYRTYSQDAEYAWLEQYARLQGKRRGLKMKAQFQSEIDQMKTELDDLVRSFKKGDYSDGLNGCSLK